MLASNTVDGVALLLLLLLLLLQIAGVQCSRVAASPDVTTVSRRLDDDAGDTSISHAV